MSEKANLPFYWHVALAVTKKLADRKGIPYIRIGGKPMVLIDKPHIPLLPHGQQQVLVTCVRAGLEHPAAIPMLLYPNPNESLLRQRMTDNPNVDPGTEMAPSVIFVVRVAKAKLAEGSGTEDLIWNIINLSPMFPSRKNFEVDFFLNSESTSGTVRFVAQMAAYGEHGLLLASADKNTARRLIDQSVAHYNYDEAKHRKFTDSLLQSYQKECRIRLP